KRLATDAELAEGIAILMEALQSTRNRPALRDRFQKYVWKLNRGIQDPRWEILGELAHDLEYYATDPTVDGPPFYGDAEFERRIRSTLERLAKANERPVA